MNSGFPFFTFCAAKSASPPQATRFVILGERLLLTLRILPDAIGRKTEGADGLALASGFEFPARG